MGVCVCIWSRWRVLWGGNKVVGVMDFAEYVLSGSLQHTHKRPANQQFAIPNAVDTMLFIAPEGRETIPWNFETRMPVCDRLNARFFNQPTGHSICY